MKHATDRLSAELTHARRVVRVLDAFIRKDLRHDPGLLSAWNAAKRVRKTASATPAVVPPTALTSAAA